MSQRQAFLDRSVGEARGVVFLDGAPERLIIVREGDGALQVGARFAARVRKVEPAFASAFLEFNDGQEGLLAFKTEYRPVEGQMLEVEVRSEPRFGKLATVRAIGAGEGKPRLLASAPSLIEQLEFHARDTKIIEGLPAREAADLAETEALEMVHALPGGGSLAIEPTRALVAIDVDLGERTGQDAKRITRQANLTALAVAARLLRLKGLGGIVIIDLVGRGHDGNALMAAARAAFSPDNPGVAIGPVGRFGTIELSIPRRGRAAREILLDDQGRVSELTLALRLVRMAQSEAQTNPGARLIAHAAPAVAQAAAPLVAQLNLTIGGRLSLSQQSAWRRDRLEVIEG